MLPLLVQLSYITAATMASLPPGNLDYMLGHRHDSRGPVALAAAIVIHRTATAAVMHRLIARGVSKQPSKADDGWISIITSPAKKWQMPPAQNLGSKAAKGCAELNLKTAPISISKESEDKQGNDGSSKFSQKVLRLREKTCMTGQHDQM